MTDPGRSRLVRRCTTAQERALLERWVRSGTTPQRTVRRSRIILMLDERLPAREVARRLGVSRHTVELWALRFAEEGCEALTKDRPGRGRKPTSAGLPHA